MAVVAHADDETLGCGGTLARHAAAGDRVSVLTFTDGVSARGLLAEEALREAIARREHFAAALDTLGTWHADQYPEVRHSTPWFRTEDGSGWLHMSWSDQQLDIVPLLQVAQAVEGGIGRFLPDVIYTHSAADLNLDHRIVHQAVLTACRPVARHQVPELYAFEVPSSTEWGDGAFRPTLFVDISHVLNTKLHAMACYAKEARAFPHPRSPEALKALAQWRGATAGVLAAEAFEVLRVVRGLTG